MGIRHALLGMTFGRLTVVRGPLKGGRNWIWECQCLCGNTCSSSTPKLVAGEKKSCGCLQHDALIARLTRHGGACNRGTTREYRAWLGAKYRCGNPHNKAWVYYGGRGIEMCAEWRENFKTFLDDMGPCPQGFTLERKDVNGHYQPNNCIWETRLGQARNRRNNLTFTFHNETHCLTEWADITGITLTCLRERVRNGWTAERALTTPVQTQSR